MEPQTAVGLVPTYLSKKEFPKGILSSQESAEMKMTGFRTETSEDFNLPPSLRGLPQHLIGFVLSSFPNGLPSSPGDASSLVAAAMEESKAPSLAGMSSELRDFVFSAFPNGLPPAPTDGPGLVNEASKLHTWPRSESLTKTQCEFIDAKLLSGYVAGQGEEQLERACQISHLQSEMTFFESKQNEELRKKITALGGDPDPQDMEKFGIKAILGFVALGIAAANPLLVAGVVAGKMAANAATEKDTPSISPS